MSTSTPYDRYHRQMILPGFGEDGQRKLQDARVLVVGAGGLGCPVLQYLAGAGVGLIGVVEDDAVSESNLHRQPLFTMDDIGRPKATVAVYYLRRLNPEICVNAFPFRLTNAVCAELFPAYQLVIDCTDNFATRYMINDACLLMDRPLVSGAVSRYEGQVMVLNAGTGVRTSYRDLFPLPPREGEVLSCAEAGVLGPLPGVIGSMMAAEAIKLLTGIGQPLVNRLLTYGMLNQYCYDVHILPNPANVHGPASLQAFLETDYAVACGMTADVTEISPAEFAEMLQQSRVLAVDVRESGELPSAADLPHVPQPLSGFDTLIPWTEPEHIIFFCQAGMRSLQAAGRYLPHLQNGQRLYSLRGGILAWKSHTSIHHV
jgi:adenylyltransferase/sulfurtransferase